MNHRVCCIDAHGKKAVVDTGWIACDQVVRYVKSGIMSNQSIYPPVWFFWLYADRAYHDEALSRLRRCLDEAKTTLAAVMSRNATYVAVAALHHCPEVKKLDPTEMKVISVLIYV